MVNLKTSLTSVTRSILCNTTGIDLSDTDAVKKLVNGPVTGTVASSRVGGEYSIECYYFISRTFRISHHPYDYSTYSFVYFG